MNWSEMEPDDRRRFADKALSVPCDEHAANVGEPCTSVRFLGEEGEHAIVCVTRMKTAWQGAN